MGPKRAIMADGTLAAGLVVLMPSAGLAPEEAAGYSAGCQRHQCLQLRDLRVAGK